MPSHIIFPLVALLLAAICVARPLSTLEADLTHSNFSASTRQSTYDSIQDLKDEINNQPLSLSQKQDIVDEATRLWLGLSPHITFVKSRFNRDMAQELDNVRNNLRGMNNYDFHDRMRETAALMQDFHSVYFPPYPLRNVVATVGFILKPYYVNNNLKVGLFFAAKHYAFIPPDMPIGSEIIKVGNVNVEKAAKDLGKKSYGGNAASQFLEGLLALTGRTHTIGFPEKVSETFDYIHPNGTSLSITLPWKLIISNRKRIESESMIDYDTPPLVGIGSPPQPLPDGVNVAPPPDALRKLYDVSLSSKAYEPRAYVHAAASARQETENVATTFYSITPELDDHMYLMKVRTPDRNFAVLKIVDFDFILTNELVQALFTALQEMPRGGTVVDLRENPGGYASTAYFMCQFLTPATVPPQPFILPGTKQMYDMMNHDNKTPTAKQLALYMKAGVRQAWRAKEVFTGPLTDFYVSGTSTVLERAPRQPQLSNGPVITLVNANSYSAGDLFPAWVKDGRGGFVLGTSSQTGGGGSNVFSHSSLVDYFPNAFKTLPGDVLMSSANVRIYRHDRNSGRNLQYQGVKVDEMYKYTKNDWQNTDVPFEDLYIFLGNKLGAL